MQFYTAGVDFIPLQDLPADCPIATNGGAFAEPMAEHALAMTFAAAKQRFIEHHITRYICFGACAAAPNIVVMPDRLWYSSMISAYVDTVTAAIHQGEDMPGLANHGRPEIREAVFTRLDELQAT